MIDFILGLIFIVKHFLNENKEKRENAINNAKDSR